MSEFPNSTQVAIDDIDTYIKHIFREHPWPASSQPLVLDASCETLNELDVFRILGHVFTHGISHLYTDANTQRVPLDLMTDKHLDHIRKCFNATGYDFVLNPNEGNPLINKCLPTKEPRSLRIPKDVQKTEWLTVLFHPI